MSGDAPGAPLVLVVEDNDNARDALSTMLDAYGFRVAGAGSVSSALAAARTAPPAAVLLDLTLPDGDGLEVPRTLGTDPPVVLALTGHDDPATAAACRAAGCRAVLVKPISPAALVAALAEAGVAA